MIKAYLGGSFNPPHFGHLMMAQAVSRQANAQTYLMPSHNPFKNKADDSRLGLLKLAVDEFNHIHHTSLDIEKIEINSTTYPTYTLDTLQQLIAQRPSDSLIFIIGQDSFENLPKWKGGFDLLNYCHLWVFGRGEPLQAGKFCQIDEIFDQKNGKIYWDNTQIPDISSTYLRNTIKNLWQNGADLHHFYQTLSPFMPKRVIAEIYKQKLYDF